MAKKKRVVTRLKNLDAHEVSLVPVGANNRTLLVTKSGGQQMDELLKEMLEKGIENEEEFEARITKLLPEGVEKAKHEELMGAAKAALKIMQGLKKRLPEGSDKVLQALEEMAGLKKTVAKSQTREGLLEELKKEGFTIEAPKKEIAMDPKVKEAIEEIRKETDSKFDAISKERDVLEEKLKKEQDLRITRELVEKAKGMGYVGEEVDETVEILKAAKESMEEEAYGKLVVRLEKSAKLATVSKALGGEIGSSQAPANEGGETYEARMKLAKEEIRKENPKMGEAELEVKALESDPSLYNAYLDDNPKQGGR